MEQFDVVVIGGGPGGYVSAIRCAQLGLKTACVDQWINKQGKPALGGTCLNVGCIPSKALLESSEHFESLQKHGLEHGITVDNLRFDATQLIKRKDDIVKQLTGGIQQLFQANGIQWFQGRGKLLSNKDIQVTSQEGQVDVIQAQSVILATGSIPIDLPIAPQDHDRIVNSESALNWTEVPKTLGVIGAGVIGLELGSVWRRLGAEVTVLEADASFLKSADKDLSKTALRELKKQGLRIHLNSKVQKAQTQGDQVLVEYQDEKGTQTMQVDRLIVAVGRRANTDGIADDSLGLKINERGMIEVDEHCQTNLPNVYAIGDCVRGPMLAHKASEEGVAVAERLAGQKPHIDFNTIPWVIYTQPEMAWVGLTEQAAQDLGKNIKVGSFPFAANGRAKVMHGDQGFIKVIADQTTARILGVHILGSMASELIGQAVIAMECETTTEDLARMVFAHPSLSESLHEAMLAVDGRAIHAVNKKRS